MCVNAAGNQHCHEEDCIIISAHGSWRARSHTANFCLITQIDGDYFRIPEPLADLSQKRRLLCEMYIITRLGDQNSSAGRDYTRAPICMHSNYATCQMNAAHATERQNITHTQCRSLLQGMCEGNAAHCLRLILIISSLTPPNSIILQLFHHALNFLAEIVILLERYFFLIDELTCQFVPAMAYCWLNKRNCFKNNCNFDSLRASSFF